MDLIEIFKNLPTTLVEFVAFIATPTVLGPILSELLEYWKWFQEQVAAVKVLVLYSLMVLVGVLSYVLVHWKPAVAALEWLQPVYAIMVAAGVFFVVSQRWHNKMHNGEETIKKVVDVKATVVEEKALEAKPLIERPSESDG